MANQPQAPRINEFGEIIDDNAPAGGLAVITQQPPIAVPATTSAAKPAKKGNRAEWWGLTVGFAVFCLLAIGLGAYFWTDGVNTSKVANAPKPTPTPVIPTATPDPFADQFNAAELHYNGGDKATTVNILAPIVASNPNYQQKAALLLFNAYVYQAEDLSVPPLDYKSAPATFQKAIDLANKNKTILEQQAQNPANSTLLHGEASFDAWLAQVQNEQTWANDFVAYEAAPASDLATKISKLEDIYKGNHDYLHGTSTSGNDYWVVVLLYNAYAAQNDTLCTSNQLDQAKAVLAKGLKLLDDNKELPDNFHLQARQQNGGCS